MFFNDNWQYCVLHIIERNIFWKHFTSQQQKCKYTFFPQEFFFFFEIPQLDHWLPFHHIWHCFTCIFKVTTSEFVECFLVFEIVNIASCKELLSTFLAMKQLGLKSIKNTNLKIKNGSCSPSLLLLLFL